jgi:magnesium transporter
MFRKRHPAAGSQPGSLVQPEAAVPPRIRLMDYGPDHCEELEIQDFGELEQYRDSETVSWIDIQGLGDLTVLQRVGEMFSIHPLALEAAVNAPVRPRSEIHESHHLIVARMVRLEEKGKILREQITLLIGERHLITIQERHGDVFDPVRRRIRAGPRFRGHGPDYLAYALLDAVIDGYYPVLEALGERLEELEQRILLSSAQDAVAEVYQTRRELLGIRRAVYPQREVVASLMRDDSPFIGREVQVHLRDCYEHAIQISDVIETYREIAGSLVELNMSILSNRMNRVMQVLTLIASVFIPLTLIAGIYGMNFEHMPELELRWGYPAALLAMAGIGFGMVLYFRHRGWIARESKD